MWYMLRDAICLSNADILFRCFSNNPIPSEFGSPVLTPRSLPKDVVNFVRGPGSNEPGGQR